MDLATLQKQLADQQGKLPPVDKWNPDFCGDMDLVIKHDGSWFYMGTPIGRKPLVKLFASVLKKEDEKYYLVTPVEKLGIKVEDVPYVITQWEVQDDLLIFTTQTDEQVVVSASHPVELKDNPQNQLALPYINVRRNLWARLHQNVYYQLIEQAEQQGNALYISSGDYQFCLGHL
ncbi:DUF1285 domain-containing protein [Paraglaciecola polaris]|uniref:DUF1285 domain-containing protein n=1 Tax=Paraglaciecola polaris LMG 21857 TaxID=1129793 RepID=K6Z4P8_9ALTE|nr:DUF1285 domain-containing protein [Paraglaciecola polaris]GAC31196.1 hypothetical protein GPLA_0277 [Paraglaciecola polaris LMG 21857]